MKPTSRFAWSSLLALVLALPTAFFICISILKYELNVSGLESAEALFERMGIRESFGWNINLLILFGPILAILLTIFQVLKIKWDVTKDQFQFHFTVQKKWLPILVAAFSGGLLAILFLYAIGENCNC